MTENKMMNENNSSQFAEYMCKVHLSYNALYIQLSYNLVTVEQPPTENVQIFKSKIYCRKYSNVNRKQAYNYPLSGLQNYALFKRYFQRSKNTQTPLSCETPRLGGEQLLYLEL